MSTKRARCLVLSVVCLLTCVFAESAFAASEISVVREWDDVEIPNGGSFGFGLAPANTSDSRRFRIHNTGNTNLVIGNPTTLVSGEGFSMIAEPVGTVHAGMSTTFRVQFLASAPGDYHGAITINSNDADENPYVIHLYGGVTPPPSPDIAVVREWDGGAVPNGGSHSFGNEPPNTPDSRIFRIHNTGNANLNISNPTTLVSGEAFSMIAYPVGTVPAGASTIFRVQFVASAPGDYQGAITIHSDDADENPYVIHLHGAVTAPFSPEIAVVREWDGVAVPNGGSFSFGTEPANNPESRIFRIHNTGNASLNISNPTTLVSGEGFSMIAYPVGTVHAGASTIFRVQFVASAPGDYHGAITIHSNDPDENPYVIHLHGAVTAPSLPEIAVFRDWDNVAVPDGGSFAFPNAVTAGSADSRRFRITNSGSAPLTLANPATLVSGTCFSQMETPATPIAAGASAWLQVRILCSTPGTYSGTVSIQNNDADENPYDFTVSGTVVPPAPQAPEIALYRHWDNVGVPDGGSYVYPAPVQPGQADSKTFRIENSGSATLTIANPSSLVSGTCFSQSGASPASSIAPGGSTTFTVQVLCSNAGTYNGTVTIQNNDGNENPYDVALQAQVTAGDFNVSVRPDFMRVQRGKSITASVSVAGLFGFNSPVSLSVIDLPAGTTASFQPASIPPGGSSTLTIHAVSSGPFGDFSIRVRGTAGGLTRNMTATLRVMDPQAKPAITAIQPETIPAGETSTVTLTGTNFHTSEVTMGSGTDRAFPTIKVMDVSADGTRMELMVDATDPAVLHHYALYVKNFHGEDGINFRVIPAGPVIDFWSPSEAAGGTLYAMDLVGVNLQGAVVIAPGGGVSVFDVDSSEDELLSAFLKVEAGAPNGPIDLIIRGRDGEDATIRVEILQQRSEIRQKTSAMTDSKGEPLFYMQELKAREDLLQPKLTKNTASVHGGFEFQICAEWGRGGHRGRVWTRTWFKNPLTGEWGPFGDLLLDNLRIGEIRLLQTLTFSRWFFIDFSIHFRVCLSEDWGFDYDVEACISGEAGFHIPIVGGVAIEFEFCLGSPSRYEIDITGTGFLNFIQFHRRGNTGEPEELQCVRITDLDPKSLSGERTFEVELLGCCSENVGVGWGGEFYLGSMQVNSQPVGTARPGQEGPEPCLELRFTTKPNAPTRVIDPYPHSNVRIGVLSGDTLIFRGEPALSNNQYLWGGVMSGGTGQETSVHFSLSGSFIGTLSALGTTRSARITVKNEPPPPNEEQWGIRNLPIAFQVLQLRDEAVAWADREFGPDPTGNGRSNAARHAYGVCLVTIHFGLEAAEGAAMAHERTNLETGSRDIHNAMVMDLENNAKALIFSGPLTTEAQCQAAVREALDNGELTILDDPENPGGNSLLIPSR